MDIQKELKTLAWIVVVFASIFFMPLGSERFLTAIDAILDPIPMVCPGTCRPLSVARFLYSRSDSSLCQSRFRYQVFRSERKEVVVLYGCRRFGRHLGRMFMHYPSVVYQHI